MTVPPRLRWLVEPGSPAVELGRRFDAAGHQLYLVGGSLRDALLDRPHQDLDFATDAHPDQVRRVVAGWAEAVHGVGERFGTVAAIRHGHVYEITTFRSEIYQDDSRKPHVEFSGDVVSDLSRRDFTINAIALRFPEPELVDPFGGLADLAAGALRTPMPPEVAFSDDPLRMLRLHRFVATLGFTPDPAAEAAVQNMSGRLQIVSGERIRDEFTKLLSAPYPEAALWGVVRSGLAAFFLPELVELEMEQDPVQRHKDVLAHSIAVTVCTSPVLVLRLAALLHDIGKPATRAFGPAGVSFHHHEVVGARMARERLRALRYPRQVVDDVGDLVFLHLRPHTYKMGWTDAAVRRYVRDAGRLLDPLNELVRCDVTTRNARRARAVQNRIDELEIRIEKLGEQEELARLRAPIDGHQVMSYLGIEPGPLVGEIMRMLLERRIEDGPYGTDDGYAMVRQFAIDRGLTDPGPPPEGDET
jgi:poly(A) polymerase